MRENTEVLHKRLEFFFNRAKDLEIIIERLLTTAHLPKTSRRRIEAHDLAQRAISKERIEGVI